MNRRQLAARIWESVNEMRSKIDSSEYKDYILGLLFYRFLSEREETWLRDHGYEGKDIPGLTGEDSHLVASARHGIGYFIAYDNLYSTWLAKGENLKTSDVSKAFEDFDRSVDERHRSILSGVFDTLEGKLSKLGDAPSQTKAIRSILGIIKDVPMDSRQGYDVLGYVYEYLISNFAADAGKKAGEFYTPHEVSVLMAEIVAGHLSRLGNRPGFSVYDPTSGSGSLLITIGEAMERHTGTRGNIHYYAQELKPGTYDLTRMNLVMHGVGPDDITMRNGDTLSDDWPRSERGLRKTYEPLLMDACVSNPPYSQGWEPPRGPDPRFDGYGLAPRSRADYAFLLHDLHHLKSDGIMCIVMPHGTLFRDEECQIRRRLVEEDDIDAIIGLPSNVFFGTGISTVIMVLRKDRTDDDNVLFIDASKGFVKDGKKNRLRSSDIRRAIDAYEGRTDVERLCRAVTKDEIRENGYNLNIPRYVDSSEPSQGWDLYSTMFGGIPVSEVDALGRYWGAFPGLRDEVFEPVDTEGVRMRSNDIDGVVRRNRAVRDWKGDFRDRFDDFGPAIFGELIDETSSVVRSPKEDMLVEEMDSRLRGMPLVDRYVAYQKLDDAWQTISEDLETLRTEGFDALCRVEPDMVPKRRNDMDVMVQDGWVGHVLPFGLVQRELLEDDVEDIRNLEERLKVIRRRLRELVGELGEEDMGQPFVNDSNDGFVAKEVRLRLGEAYDAVKTPELDGLRGYVEFLGTGPSRRDRQEYVSRTTDVDWGIIRPNSDGTYGKKNVTERIREILGSHEFRDGSLEATLSEAARLLDEESRLKGKIKTEKAELDARTKETIEHLNDTTSRTSFRLLYAKWVTPLVEDVNSIPDEIVDGLVRRLRELGDRYEMTFHDLNRRIQDTETSLSGMLRELTGDDRDVAGIDGLARLLGGETP